MVSLGQKLNMLKTCEKRFYKRIRVVLCKNTAEKKKPSFEERKRFWKSAILEML